ncbi:MAG: hypothetical protein IIA64_04050 [Planctomycetes bacterium]|nr:hypothetical protein [Planctomycetota bacterium]
MSRRRCVNPDRAIAARHAAARQLREARRAVGDDSAEAVDWAFSQLPDSLGARRMKIQQLVDQGDLESASVLVAQGLLQRPTDPSLTLWRARILYRREEFEQCARELRLVLARRPHHFATLGLAGLAAHRLNAPVRAASFFARAEARRPGDVPTLHLLVDAWIDAGRLDKAGRVLSRIDSPPARLSAKYLRAQGRLLEAAEALETALGRGRSDEDEAVLCDLITILEESGNMARLRRVLERIDVRQPAALARAGLAWLWLGEFRTAAVRTARLARVPASRSMGLLVLLVASAMLQRPTLVERALGRLRRIDDAIDPDVVGAEPRADAVDVEDFGIEFGDLHPERAGVGVPIEWVEAVEPLHAVGLVGDGGEILQVVTASLSVYWRREHENESDHGQDHHSLSEGVPVATLRTRTITTKHAILLEGDSRVRGRGLIQDREDGTKGRHRDRPTTSAVCS